MEGCIEEQRMTAPQFIKTQAMSSVKELEPCSCGERGRLCYAWQGLLTQYYLG